jgi:phosphoribosylformylglycinamidine cyclo-ligase
MLSIHRSYLNGLKPVLGRIHAMAHITGGGIPGNVDRALPSDLAAYVDASTWEIPAVFSVLESAGKVPRDEMLRVFNMGVGMVVIAPADAAEAIVGSARVAGIVGWVMGEMRRGDGEVVIV